MQNPCMSDFCVQIDFKRRTGDFSSVQSEIVATLRFDFNFQRFECIFDDFIIEIFEVQWRVVPVENRRYEREAKVAK